MVNIYCKIKCAFTYFQLLTYLLNIDIYIEASLTEGKRDFHLSWFRFWELVECIYTA